jgi:rare lipoprotein A
MKIFYIVIVISLFISSCTTQKKQVINNDYYKRSEKISKDWEEKADINKKYAGHYKIGKPYTIKNKKYYPKQVNQHSEIGIASWYKCDYNFKYCLTANQDVFHKDMLTAAHKTLPLPSLIKVINLENKKSLIVMVNDRGPFKPQRIVDLSEKAADLLGFKNKGIAKVKIEYLNDETNKLHKKLSLIPKENKYSQQEMLNKKCGIKRYINTLNMKYKLVNSEDLDMDYKSHCLAL